MSSAYEKGLEKLGMMPDQVQVFNHAAQSFTVNSKWPDLRTDPAFAWRVLEHLMMRRHQGKPVSVTFTPNYCITHVYPTGETVDEGHAGFPAEQLYALVEAIGKGA